MTHHQEILGQFWNSTHFVQFARQQCLIDAAAEGEDDLRDADTGIQDSPKNFHPKTMDAYQAPEQADE